MCHTRVTLPKSAQSLSLTCVVDEPYTDEPSCYRLVTLAVQNALLTIIMHYSRVSIPSSRAYSPAAAVLMNELLKGFISLVIAFSRLDGNASQMDTRRTPSQVSRTASLLRPAAFIRRCHRLGREVFSPDCWKLSIPAILYGIVPTFPDVSWGLTFSVQ